MASNNKPTPPVLGGGQIQRNLRKIHATQIAQKVESQIVVKFMKIGKKIRAYSVGLGMLALAACAASGQTINQSGGSGTTYTGIDEGQGSSNKGRDIASATIVNNATDLIITLNLNPAGNIENQGAFDYVIGITTGAGAGGDTSANATTHGNAYDRDIDFNSTDFGGMTDFIGIFGAGGSGSTGSPYTSFGFNDYVFGTPGSTGVTAGSWKQIDNVASGEPISVPSGGSNPTSVTITVPMSDFADNLVLTAGTVIDFDIDCTGTSANTTAYGSLADPNLVQPGVPSGGSGAPYSGTYQFDETELDQYTITATPEPGMLALIGLGGLGGLLTARLNRERKQS
jgi:hypothetical protein